MLKVLALRSSWTPIPHPAVMGPKPLQKLECSRKSLMAPTYCRPLFEQARICDFLKFSIFSCAARARNELLNVLRESKECNDELERLHSITADAHSCREQKILFRAVFVISSCMRTR